MHRPTAEEVVLSLSKNCKKVASFISISNLRSVRENVIFFYNRSVFKILLYIFDT